ncbi:MAG: prepilin-type N-terminal cleavage/methylation domain-containing protein, partial [Pseudomonadales bacterium]|nr:prepilin-type N-terminal cleavage/methylation domain-containing protein [Pseudomonadales bacterium]
MMRDRSNGSRQRPGGFSLIELMVALALTGILMTGLFALTDVTARTTRSGDALGVITENLRIGLETLQRDIMMAGFSGTNGPLTYVDATDGCSPLAFLQASDFQLTLIGDLNGSGPAGGTADSPEIDFYGESVCSDPACGTCANPIAAGALQAEVVRWSFDWDGDGIQRDGSGDLTFDAAGEAAAEANDLGDDGDGLTLNPADLRLVRETSIAGVSTGQSVEIAYGLRGRGAGGALPTDANGVARPMFAYWLDQDGDGLIRAVADGGADTLHGDTNANGLLDAGELPAGSVAKIDLKKIIRVDIFLRAEALTPDA